MKIGILGGGQLGRMLIQEALKYDDEFYTLDPSSDCPCAGISHFTKGDFNDYVLLIHEGQKSVSSTVGHGLMNTNPYAERRFQEARENFVPMKEILKLGDLQAFMKLVEHEALTLHAMMMMSDPAFILMQKGTLQVINRVWEFRKETNLPLFFTLDAGANVHLLFPSEKKAEISNFIETELLRYTQNGGIVRDFMKF